MPRKFQNHLLAFAPRYFCCTVQDEHNTPTIVTYIDISAKRANFYVKFYETVKQLDVHFITKFS